MRQGRLKAWTDDEGTLFIDLDSGDLGASDMNLALDMAKEKVMEATRSQVKPVQVTIDPLAQEDREIVDTMRLSAQELKPRRIGGRRDP